MKNKKLLAMLTGIMLLSSFGFCLGQSALNVPIISGNTTEQTMYISEYKTADVGGLVSNIENHLEQNIMFGGVKLWKQQWEEAIPGYTLLAIQSGSLIDLYNLIVTDNGVFQTTEPNIVANGVTGTWDTHNISILNDINDEQIPMILTTDFVTLSNGDKVYGSNVAELTYAVTGNEPTTEQLISAYGSGSNQAKSSVFNGYNVVMFVQGAGLKYIVDLNNDGIWNLKSTQNNGFSVVAQSGESVAILPVGSYDIFGIVG